MTAKTVRKQTHARHEASGKGSNWTPGGIDIRKPRTVPGGRHLSSGLWVAPAGAPGLTGLAALRKAFRGRLNPQRCTQRPPG